MPAAASTDMGQVVFRYRHAVTVPSGPPGDGQVPARQFDAVLMTLGFKASGALMTALNRLDPGSVIDTAVEVLGWVRQLTGAAVQHNVYFKNFPAGVPDTYEFWAGLLGGLVREVAVGGGRVPASVHWTMNLLDLPGYGTYRHTYEDMLAVHDELLPALTDRLTVVHLAGSLQEEAASLFAELAGATVPLSSDRLDDLRLLAACAQDPAPVDILVRENKAVINAARVRAGLWPQAVNSPTDILRLAAELSGGDVTLTRPPRFTPFRAEQRRLLLAAIEVAVRWEDQLGEVRTRAEQWKRLAYRLHPSEKNAGPRTLAVFKVARGEYPARSVTARAEGHLDEGDTVGAAWQLAKQPGLLWRNADRLLRNTAAADLPPVLRRFELTAGNVSGRVLLSVREHLANRTRPGELPRMFPGRQGRAWVTPDRRPPLDPGAVTELTALIDAEISRRLPAPGHLVTDPAIRGAALPLTGKPAAGGLGIWPRGSLTPVDGDTLRFFCHWQQNQHRTDYDLSVLFLDPVWGTPRWVSYTSLTIGADAAVHSGDLTEAPPPAGSSEFVHIQLPRFNGYIVPQVYVFAGEGFTEAAEAFTGYMTGDAAQRGLPFEPRLVRAMSPLTGDSRIALPSVFYQDPDGRWYCKWMHLYPRARTSLLDGGARVEENKATVGLLARTVASREYLRAGYLLDLLAAKAARITSWPAGWPAPQLGGDLVTYIGPYRPDGLPPAARVITLNNLQELIPQ